MPDASDLRGLHDVGYEGVDGIDLADASASRNDAADDGTAVSAADGVVPDGAAAWEADAAVVGGPNLATERIKIRVGIPKTGGALIRAARDLGYPILLSANAFAKTYGPNHEKAGDFSGFSWPDPDQFQGLDAALDSAGFVAAVKYGDYRWTVDAYMRLAASHPWAWWASMDYCCEAEVAGDRQLRMLRIAATCQMLGLCNAGADRAGIKRPMPVIQGWHASEYAQCIEWMPLQAHEWPEIVGVGSVCRRQLHGENGILNIVATLDRLLPPGVKLHLFGVKGGTLEALGAHPRIGSMDSMAWDFGARIKRRTGRDMAFRIECMQAWAEQHNAIADRMARAEAAAPRGQMGLGILGPLYDRNALGLRCLPEEEIVLEALTLSWCDFLLENQVEYADARYRASKDAFEVASILRQYDDPLCDASLEHLEEHVGGGISDHVCALASSAGIPRDAAANDTAGWQERLRANS